MGVYVFWAHIHSEMLDPTPTNPSALFSSRRKDCGIYFCLILAWNENFVNRVFEKNENFFQGENGVPENASGGLPLFEKRGKNPKNFKKGYG